MEPPLDKPVNFDNPNTDDYQSFFSSTIENIRAFKALGVKINNLSKTTLSYWNSCNIEKTSEDLARQLKIFDESYKSYKQECQKSLPRLLEIKSLSARLVSHTPHYPPVGEKEQQLTAVFEACVNALNTLKEELKKTENSFSDTCKHLNNIDAYLTTLPGGLWNGLFYYSGFGATETRKSPFDEVEKK